MAVAALVVIPTAVLTIQGARQMTASMLGASASSAAIRLGLAVQPGNPELRHRLGLEDFYSAQNGSPAQGLALLRQAASLGADRAVYWADVAAACEALSDFDCADAATRRALMLQPMMPHLHWVAAGYYLSNNRPDAAESQLRQLLTMSAMTYAEPVFSLCLRHGLNPQTVTERIMPAAKPPALMLEYAYYLAAHGQFEPASQVWKETVANPSSFPFSITTPYLDTLMGRRQYAQAWSAWEGLEKRGLVNPGNAANPGNLVFNGSFTTAPLNTGFDWICGQEAFVSLEFPGSDGRRGARGLRLVFTVSRNRDYEPIFQIVPVTPGRSYLLSADVRSTGITSDSGPRLRVIDPLNPSALSVASAGTIGTTPWRPVRITFYTGPMTHFIQLSVWRSPSRGFPSGIIGTFGIDRVSLKLSPAPREAHPPSRQKILAGTPVAPAAHSSRG